VDWAWSSVNTITLTHLVLTVADIERSVTFYSAVLGMTPATFGAGQRAVRFGDQAIVFQTADGWGRPAPTGAAPGAAALCLITDTPLLGVEYVLARLNIEIVAGPLPRTGPDGPLMSLTIRDPDGNLIEIANRR
jgi:catechol 2,3-dioxygenase-like lactoylglutathione lyase family enzyme